MSEFECETLELPALSERFTGLYHPSMREPLLRDEPTRRVNARQDQV